MKEKNNQQRQRLKKLIRRNHASCYLILLKNGRTTSMGEHERKFSLQFFLLMNKEYSNNIFNLQEILLFRNFISLIKYLLQEPCQTVSYLFSVLTRLTYWLASWVTIDRLFVIFPPTSTALEKPCLSIGVSAVTALCLFSMHIHDFIYYTTIQHLSIGSKIYVANFNIHFISTYNYVATLIHYPLSFFIQVIAITLLIFLAARSRTKTSGGKRTFRQVLIKQFCSQKERYMTPMIIIRSALSQTILIFSLACTELTVWHRQTLLVTYLFSYTPQVLDFILYALPSTRYKKEFSETLFAR
jgi:hypothetical protein